MTMPVMDEAEWGPFEALARISNRPPALPSSGAGEATAEEPRAPSATVEELRGLELQLDAEGWAGRLA